MSDKERNIDWELAARILSGEGDEIDEGLLEQWLNADPKNRKEWQNIKAAWESGEDARLLDEIDTSSAWTRVKRFTVDDAPSVSNSAPRRSHRLVWASVAAGFVLLIGLAWGFLSPFSQNSSSLIVSSNDREEIELSDGSHVTLNSGSRFTCDQPFEGKERVVNLNGEGYFRVEGNRERPFVVKAGEITIRVTGTRFNVQAYPNLSITEVSVIEGSVEVVPPSGSEKKTLQGGQVALFEKNTGRMTIEDQTDPNVLAWITGEMTFRETPLKEVSQTLERVYGVDIQLSDSSLGREKLTASFSDNSLDFVLRVVCVTFNLDSHREGDTIFLSRTSERE
ncbi:MAG: FecR family protein [Marinilabiliaceae bacterium]